MERRHPRVQEIKMKRLIVACAAMKSETGLKNKMLPFGSIRTRWGFTATSSSAAAFLFSSHRQVTIFQMCACAARTTRRDTSFFNFLDEPRVSVATNHGSRKRFKFASSDLILSSRVLNLARTEKAIDVSFDGSSNGARKRLRGGATCGASTSSKTVEQFQTTAAGYRAADWKTTQCFQPPERQFRETSSGSLVDSRFLLQGHGVAEG